jgi:hypothetical protein
MSQPASRVIGIIRISESSEFDVDWTAGADDSTLGALLAGLVGKGAQQRALPHCCRWRPAAPVPRRTARRVLPANLLALREQLEQEYVELAAG